MDRTEESGIRKKAGIGQGKTRRNTMDRTENNKG